MISSFTTKFLIEQAKLDRLEQLQLREHLLEVPAIARLFNNMNDITPNQKLTSEERLNSISGFQVQFDRLNKENELLNGAIPFQDAIQALPAARFVQPKVSPDRGIKPEIEQKEEEQNEQYEDVLEEKDKLAKASD